MTYIIENKEEWLKAAWEHFDEAVKLTNVAFAKDIIADVQELGFLEDGRKMSEKLRDINI